MKQHSPLFLKLVTGAKEQVDLISAKELKEKMMANHAVTIIDVREEHEWRQGHIPHAIHLSKGIIERDIEKTIPKLDQTLVLYCSGGFRSVLAASNLKKMGYTKVYSLERGFTHWSGLNYPIENE
jgi:rhodanese-related sulfurtransferase